ncbi:methionine ABC transporter ATP-binding protein [Intestinirhabdus alba]|uniref:Cell division ATP-binding protein FtsE n=1 Tax=Intestinirhabdus alba TaxID=2899544 RepID=A0A6L6IFV9_9ENTR|nr:ATP-binding cassette domain-containing protein [Intestinirhabdus alba]MTH45722.1 ATP-binding cassette domain-containing protein [Intestinirhabdus alba]
MISIRSLSKSYSGTTILDNINLDIIPGEIHGLLGASGAGKSTLLRCINGLEQFSPSGRVRVDNIELQNLSSASLRAFRKNTGMIFQDFALLERKTALENVMLPMTCWQKKTKELRLRAMGLLQSVGMEDKADHRPAQLSGGQKQRVAIARALALKPKVLLCDEATSALDPATAKSILDLLKKINQESGITIVMVTHQMDVVKYICDRISVIERGRLIRTDTIKNILTSQPALLPSLAENLPIDLQQEEIGLAITLADIAQSTDLLLSLSTITQNKIRVVFTRSDRCKTGTVAQYVIAVNQPDYTSVVRYLNQNKIQFQKLAA